MAKRVIVVGGGIVGVSCASSLLREGLEVELIERERFAAGASFGNAGALSPGSCIPLAMPGILRKVPSWLLDPDGPLVVRPSYLLKALPWLVRFIATARHAKVEQIADALSFLHQGVFAAYAPILADLGPSDLIRQSGTLVVFKSPAGLTGSRREVAMRTSRKAKVEIVNADEIRQLEPGLSRAYQHGLFLPEHGYVTDPELLVRRMGDAFVANGGRLIRAEVVGAGHRLGQPHVVLSTGETVGADAVVIAAGAWSRRILEAAGQFVPLESQRGYHVTLSDPSVVPRHPVTVSEEKVYATPMRGGLRIAGTVEFAGLEAAPNWKRAQRLVEIAGRIYPGLTFSGSSQWMGHRPCLPDSLPVIGPIPGLPGVFAAFGHGHNGMTSGPVTGELIANLICNRPTPFDLRPLRFDRF
jgi:D-amino-acid dehydrogenase